MVLRSLLAAALCLASCVIPDDDGSAEPDANPASPDGADPNRPDARPVTPIGPSGGVLEDLRFAVIGDTQPENVNDTAGYPTNVITSLYQSVQDLSPRPAFVLTPGDYMFASTSSSQQNPQLDLYLAARARYSNIVFHALGNHECTGYTDDNCPPGGTSTKNYTAFMTRLVQPLGYTKPWYSFRVDAPDGAWSAKFVITACNAWNAEQKGWFDGVLDEPTTYTFVVRHEGTYYPTAPCLVDTNTILGSHAYTLVIVGHAHTFAWQPATREVIVGNGGSVYDGGTDNGYALFYRQPDGLIVVTGYEWDTKQIIRQWAVKADGTVP